MTKTEWATARAALDAHGHAVLPGLLSPGACRSVGELYDVPDLFRSHVHMARHGFGQGEYKYFADPLPPAVQALREALYPPLATIANDWMSLLDSNECYPADLAAFRNRCHAAGQTKPTPLLLRYGPGDYNCLHQDLYGSTAFPLQVTVLLTRPAEDFSGGAFVLTEQRPRMQSRVETVPLGLGDAVVFPVNRRPVRGGRGVYQVAMRHGVSRVLTGRRQTLGLIFHDAA